MYIAKVVRDAMEDFHCKNLSDSQMKELNPIIRNAIYTAVYAYLAPEDDLLSRYYVGLTTRTIPDYWEKPQFLEDYQGLMEDKDVRNRIEALLNGDQNKNK
jgi:hypothetical protein